MAYAGPVVRAVFYGTLGGGGTFSTGFFVQLGAGASVPSSDEMSGLALDIYSRATNLGVTIMQQADSGSQLLGVRTYYYPAGATKATVGGEYVLAAPVVGGGTATMPQYISIVVSLRTSTLGRSGRGRMYMLLNGYAGYVAGGQVAAALVGNYSSVTATAFSNVNSTDGSAVWYKGLTVIVASSSKSSNYPVTAVSVDSLADTQHRREDKQSATTKVITDLP